ncbi:MAG: hypothetical protein L3J43_02410 [Sulfurovum sp.]|nr:hypothetical protein [Sulfurovum sp.]
MGGIFTLAVDKEFNKKLFGESLKYWSLVEFVCYYKTSNPDYGDTLV